MTVDNAELIQEARSVAEDFADDYMDSTRAILAMVRLANALEAAEAERDAGWRMVEWGVQVGTWPPTQYATLDMAKFYAERPFNGFEEYPHVVVTRTVVSYPWKATS